MNKNPTLLIGLALAQAGEINEGDRAYAELRIYPGNGAGFFFVRANSPGRWYWMDEAGADHFNRADQAEVNSAIQEGARVQLTGNRGRSLGLWRTWEEFEKAVE